MCPPPLIIIKALERSRTWFNLNVQRKIQQEYLWPNTTMIPLRLMSTISNFSFLWRGNAKHRHHSRQKWNFAEFYPKWQFIFVLDTKCQPNCFWWTPIRSIRFCEWASVYGMCTSCHFTKMDQKFQKRNSSNYTCIVEMLLHKLKFFTNFHSNIDEDKSN